MDRVKSTIVAGVSGLVLGHVIWLLGISLARRSSNSGALVMVVAGLVLFAAVGLGYLAWQRYQRKEFQWAAFLGALPVLPMIFTTIALGVTYL